jgi:hypothetical protein
LVERLQNEKVSNLFAQGFPSIRRVARHAKAATSACLLFRTGAEGIIYKCVTHTLSAIFKCHMLACSRLRVR